MKLKLLILSFFLFAFSFGQEIKIKKNIVYVDGKEYLKIDDEFKNETVTNLSGDELFVLKKYSFEKPLPKAVGPNSHRYPTTQIVNYYVVSFLDFELEFETNLTQKKLFLAFYKYNLLNSENKVDSENAKKIASKISSEISGERPVIILDN